MVAPLAARERAFAQRWPGTFLFWSDHGLALVSCRLWSDNVPGGAHQYDLPGFRARSAAVHGAALDHPGGTVARPPRLLHPRHPGGGVAGCPLAAPPLATVVGDSQAVSP